MRIHLSNATSASWGVPAIALVLAMACAPVSGLLLAQVRSGTSPAPRPAVPGAPAGVTAFVNVAVIPMDTERVLQGQTVLVEGGWITALGRADQVVVPQGAVRIDGRGRFLLPGLADMHAHIGVSAFDTVTPEMAEQRLFLWLANGLTTVRNMDHSYNNGYFRLSGDELLRLRARAAAGEILSPRIYTAAYLGVPGRAPGPLLLEHVAEAVAAYKAAGYDFIKMHWLHKHGAVFDSLAATARRAGIPLAGHVEDVTTLERALTEYRSIEHLSGYGVDVGENHSSEKVSDPARLRAFAEATRRAGVWNCPTLYNQMKNRMYALTNAWADSLTESSRAALAAELEPSRQLIRALRDVGAGLLLGSDRLQHPPLYAPPLGPSPFDSASTFSKVYGDPSATHHELEALVDAGLTPYQALVTGTRNVAAFYGTLDESGTIAVGKRADLVLLGGNPLEDIRHTAPPAGVMIGGRWLDREAIDRRVADIEAWLRQR